MRLASRSTMFHILTQDDAPQLRRFSATLWSTSGALPPQAGNQGQWSSGFPILAMDAYTSLGGGNFLAISVQSDHGTYISSHRRHDARPPVRHRQRQMHLRQALKNWRLTATLLSGDNSDVDTLTLDVSEADLRDTGLLSAIPKLSGLVALATTGRGRPSIGRYWVVWLTSTYWSLESLKTDPEMIRELKRLFFEAEGGVSYGFPGSAKLKAPEQPLLVKF
ncbi:hypothetical protein B0H63DRAFT_544576 [Podospora didyma]|uniref:Uncharacterized protein n=1 Tax=Podospora didyma TaxID=330526 RepID=A0AAE0U064_9PEZI|nr:hypothetical protein B0H63DRAFT_544576 [Podospora didyma]